MTDPSSGSGDPSPDGPSKAGASFWKSTLFTVGVLPVLLAVISSGVWYGIQNWLERGPPDRSERIQTIGSGRSEPVQQPAAGPLDVPALEAVAAQDGCPRLVARVNGLANNQDFAAAYRQERESGMNVFGSLVIAGGSLALGGEDRRYFESCRTVISYLLEKTDYRNSDLP